jgi:hypothetical protein
MKKAYLMVVLAASALALAGSEADLIPRLTDDIVARMLPVIRAQAAEVEGGLAAMEEGMARMDEHTQLLEDIKAGKVDPLEWLKAQSKYVIAPPSAKYEQQLSRWASSSYLMDPVALFSFGIDAPEPVRNGTRNGEKGASFVLSGQDLSGVPGGKEFQAVVDGVPEFYHSKKFKDDPVQQFFMYTSNSPDSSVGVFLHYVNMFAGMPASEGVPDGPLLWLSHSSAKISAEAISESDAEAAKAASSVEEALASAGMTREAYQEYMGALVMAKSDAADPSVLDIPLDTHGLTADQAEAVKGMREFYAIRKSNLKVYRKVAAEVAPLLEKMGM